MFEFRIVARLCINIAKIIRLKISVKIHTCITRMGQ